MVIRLFFACIAGLLLLATIAPYDPWVKYYVGERFKQTFAQAMDCHIEGDTATVNIISPSLTLINVRVNDHNNNVWHWECREYSTGFSWLHLLQMKMIDMWVHITDMQMYSTVADKTVHILSHLKRIINPSSTALPLQFKHFVLHKGSLTLNDIHDAYKVTLSCNGQAKNINNIIKTRWNITQAEGVINNHRIWHSTTGSLECNIEKKQNKTPLVTAQCDISSLIIGSDKERAYFFSAVWQDSQAKISIKSQDDVFSCTPCIITHNNSEWFVKCFGRTTVKELIWAFTGKILDIDGQCSFTASGPLRADTPIKICTILNDCKYQHCMLSGGAKCNAMLHNGKIHGTFLATITHYATLAASWNYDIRSKEGSCILHNKSTINCGATDQWHVKPRDCIVKAHYDKSGMVGLKYDCTVSHHSLTKDHHIQGNIEYQNQKGTLNGHKDESETYNGSFSLTHYPYLHSFSYLHGNNALLTATCNENNIIFNGKMSLLSNLLSSWFDHELQVGGSMLLSCSFDTEKVSLHCELDNGIVRLPQTYNFIDGGCVDVIYWLRNKRLQIKKIDGSMHFGTFSLQEGSILFDDSFKPIFIHTPFVFNRCLLNMKRDLFVMVSGNLLLKKLYHESPLLAGSIIIERGQIKENILSQEFQRQIGLFSTKIFTFSPPSVKADISVDSRHGIKIDTPFLKTTAKVSLHLKDLVTQPTLSGNIALIGGVLQFPYKPLAINRGFITFSPEKEYDPSIELLARNQIRNHRLALHVTGSLLNHHITLESNPPLSDEQILGLLLAGSAQESLKNMMPALIMNNLKSLIFGSNQFNFLNKYFRPLGNSVSINLIPSFTDQYGRGGLRGALEIGVNDRWRALIQKNFSFTEDTRFELEYLFADDITLRAIRDEQKNLGFEAEMRWKF